MELTEMFGGERMLRILRQAVSQKEALTSEEAKNSLEQCDEIIKSNPELTNQVNEIRAEIKQKSESEGGCFIATATYGDYNHPHVILLRIFRDTTLESKLSGRLFIRSYYTIGPILSRIIERNGTLKKISRYWLEELVSRMKCH